MIALRDTTAVYRAHFSLTNEEVQGGGAQVTFTGCDDEGWYFINGQYLGETHDWNAAPVFDLSRFLRAGDNVIAVCCRNGGGAGGLNPAVTVAIAGEPRPLPWSRSLFNGLAQIIVQSTPEAGELRLTASADGLAPATTRVHALPCTPPPAL